KIESLMVRDIGAIDYARLGFPHVERYYSPFTTLRGWVAIGDSYYREGLSQYGWPQLRGLPYRRVGKSIRLYCVECGAHGAPLVTAAAPAHSGGMAAARQISARSSAPARATAPVCVAASDSRRPCRPA